MNPRKLGLVFIGLFAATAALGCASDQPPQAKVMVDADSPNFTAPDPAAKKVVEEKNEATEKVEQTNHKLGSTGAPGVKMPKNGEKVAVLETNYGRIILKFFPNKAPGHVKNFMDLANKKFYDGTKFHRVIPGFMIQGGDPYSKTGAGPVGTGGPGYQIKAEFNDTHHSRGILSMARSQDPDSAGSQFFITVGDAGFLDNQYTAFGQVVDGMDVADKIVALPRDGNDRPTPDEAVIKTVRIMTWPLKK